MTDEEKAVVDKWFDEITEFKTFCQSCTTVAPEDIDELGEDPFEETDFHGLSLGFFIAKGIPWIDAFDLARITRYKYGYWC